MGDGHKGPLSPNELTLIQTWVLNYIYYNEVMELLIHSPI